MGPTVALPLCFLSRVGQKRLGDPIPSTFGDLRLSNSRMIDASEVVDGANPYGSFTGGYPSVPVPGGTHRIRVDSFGSSTSLTQRRGPAVRS